MKWYNDPIQKSFLKIGLSGLSVLAFMGLSLVPGTNAYFSDSAEIGSSTFSAGYWIPELEMKITPDGELQNDKWYTKEQCVHLKAKIGEAEDKADVYYTLTKSGDNKAEPIKDNGGCIKIPDGIWEFEAQAFNKDNEKWSSNVVTHEFKVDSVSPEVDIEELENNDTVFGVIDIIADYEDENPASYRLRIKKGSNEIYDSGVVSIDAELDDENLYDWNTEDASNGVYEISLVGVDEAGNETEDKMNVKVVNVTEDEDEQSEVVNPGDVVINEIMWMGSTASTADEWIELRNMTNGQVNIGGWKIDFASSEDLALIISEGKFISPLGYFLIANYHESENTALKQEADEVNNDLFISNEPADDLVLRDQNNNEIDRAGAKPNKKWPDGESKTNLKQSMERNNIPGIGSNEDNWHTCVDEACNDETYWKEEFANGSNYGTPGAPNHSENDPTAAAEAVAVSSSQLKETDAVAKKLDTPTQSDGDTQPSDNANSDDKSLDENLEEDESADDEEAEVEEDNDIDLEEESEEESEDDEKDSEPESADEDIISNQ